MADADQAQQHGVAAGLFLRAFVRVNHQHGGFGIGRAGDHVAQELTVARCIHDHELARAQPEGDAGGIHGHTLVTFDLQAVEQEAPFNRQAALLAGFNDLRDTPVGQAVGIIQQATDQGGLAMVDMTHDHDGGGGFLRGRGRDCTHCNITPSCPIRGSRPRAGVRTRPRIHDPWRVPRVRMCATFPVPQSLRPRLTHCFRPGW